MALFPASERAQTLQPHGVAKWSLGSRIFHWISLLLLIVTWVMIELNDDAMTEDYMSLHQSFGLSVLFWTVARLINRILAKSPYTLPMPKWQTAISHLTHALLYVLLIAMPIAGLLTVLYAGETVSFFGLFDMPSFVSENSDMRRFFEKVHKDILWTTLLVFSGLHIAGALFHQFIKKDGIMSRML